MIKNWRNFWKLMPANHALYDEVYRIDILQKAWKQVKDNRGAGGIDEVSIDDIVAYGEDSNQNLSLYSRFW